MLVRKIQLPKAPVPTESEEAHTLVAYLRIHGYKFHHSANETGHTPEAIRRAVRVKREGTSAGFPDYVIVINNVLIAIELKRVRGSRVTPEQREWLAVLSACGIPSAICHGAAEAIEFIQECALNSPAPANSEQSTPSQLF